MNTPQLNRTATLIIEELKNLNAFAGDSDIRLAYEVAGLVDDDKVVDLSVKVLNDEIVINFKVLADSPVDYLRSLEEFSAHINAFGYRFISQVLDGAADITFTKPMTLKATVQEPGSETGPLQAALQQAGLAPEAPTTDAAAALEVRRQALDQVESSLATAHETLTGLGVNMTSKVYSNEPPAPAAAPAAAVKEETVAAAAAQATPWFEYIKPTGRLSDQTKVVLGVGAALVVGGATYFGLRRFGIKLPFMGRDNNVPAVTNETAAQVLDAAQAVAAYFKR